MGVGRYAGGRGVENLRFPVECPTCTLVARSRSDAEPHTAPCSSETMLFRTMAVALAALSLAACAGDGTGTGPINVTGTYTLQAFAGRRLPVALTNSEGFRQDLSGGTITLNADGTVVRRDSIVTSYNGAVRNPPLIQVRKATYFISNDTIHLPGQWPPFGVFVTGRLVLKTDTLTLHEYSR